MNKKKISATFTKCPSCGDDMVFNPDGQCLSCPSCQNIEIIHSKTQYAKHDFDLENPSMDANEKWAQDEKIMKCKNCGASVVLQGYQVSANCPYCDTSLVSAETGGEGVKPDAVVPFRIGKKLAEETFRAKIQKNWFVPKQLKQNLKADAIRAYYFPAFVYDANCLTSYDGVLYETYTVRDKEGRYHTKYRYFNISGTKSTQHANIEIEASTKLEQRELSWVRPYDFTQAKCFTNEFISGYALECYSSSIKDTFATAKTIIENDIKYKILSGYRYDGISKFNMDTTYLSKNYSYCVLPMYRVNFTYKGKQYSNVINGQSGAVGGKVPKSGGKIALVVILPILFVLSIILLTLLI
ncbi:MAG: hypothetical protein IJY90_00360 [Clostridia bacterium]|nr:hypothetical protein [Clostridia bacterium]